MSELINTTNRRHTLYWRLLTTVSAASLLGFLSMQGSARAKDDDRPQVWIELGGQWEFSDGKEEAYTPPFVLNHLSDQLGADPILGAQKPIRSGFSGEGKLSFEPEGSNWIFSASVRFGRSNAKRGAHNQVSTQFKVKNLKYATNHIFNYIPKTRFNDSKAGYQDTHLVADFFAGKDVGLGIFGRNASSVLNLGIRFAQLGARSDILFRSLPDQYYGISALLNKNLAHHHSYYAHAQTERSFSGVGPSLSWTGAAPFVGDHDNGEITLDWGLNAAALFGRQKVRGSYETTGRYFRTRSNLSTSHYANMNSINRSHSVVIPNVGGSAGVSFRYPNVKLSAGYRADFFFGAMDQGQDTRKSKTVGFYGPFATISIGLGG